MRSLFKNCSRCANGAGLSFCALSSPHFASAEILVWRRPTSLFLTLLCETVKQQQLCNGMGWDKLLMYPWRIRVIKGVSLSPLYWILWNRSALGYVYDYDISLFLILLCCNSCHQIKYNIPYTPFLFSSWSWQAYLKGFLSPEDTLFPIVLPVKQTKNILIITNSFYGTRMSEQIKYFIMCFFCCINMYCWAKRKEKLDSL